MKRGVLMNVIEINSLSKSYGKNRGISNVSFEVAKGEIFGFIGPNGAGKSTTIRTLLAYIKADKGVAKILGLDTAKDTVEIKKRCGYLPAEVAFTENLKAIDVLLYTAEFYHKDLRDRIYILSSRLNLDLNKKVDNFSLGNRKKVAIVQALMHSPEVLILDEPTSGLDPLIQSEFFDMLLEQREAGSTIMLSSHVLSEVQKYCDRVAIIREGKIIKVTSVEELTGQNFKKVSYLDVNGNNNEFVHHGSIDELTARLATLKLKNLKIEDPSLEEIFMKYYE
jgi:ABC-2 type transport system ATP-binding protein